MSVEVSPIDSFFKIDVIKGYIRYDDMSGWYSYL